MPKFMLVMRTGDAPPPADLDAMITAVGAFNEAMIGAGVLAGGDGLTDAEQGAVVEFTDNGAVVTDGAYGDADARFNGWWILDVATRDEALGWARRAPLATGTRLEVRRITDESDFAEYADNEYLQKEKEWRRDER